MACNTNGSDESNVNDCSDAACPSDCTDQTFVTSTCNCTNSCGCLPSSQNSGIPYYNAAEGCEETHQRVCVNARYVTGISVSSEFTIPICGGTADIVVLGLQQINLNTYLWNPAYGYLKVVGFDFQNSIVTVKNECAYGSPTPGLVIPACTVFNITDAAPLAPSYTACEEAPVPSGALLVCNGDGSFKVLDATDVGQIPVVTDAGTNEVEFQTLDLPLKVCTTSLDVINLLAGNSGPYGVLVADASIFSTYDVVQINGRTDRFHIVSILGPNQFTATVVPTPAAPETIPAGVDVCLADCCEQIIDLLENPCRLDLSSRQIIGVGTSVAAAMVDGDITLGEAAVYSNDATVTILNEHCTNKLIHLDAVFMCHFFPADATPAGDEGKFVIYPMFAVTTGLIGAAPAPVPATIQAWYESLIRNTIAEQATSFHYEWRQDILIVPGDEAKFTSRLGFAVASGDAGFTVNYHSVYNALKYFTINV